MGSVITFYSYKGGTGRTMALANVACLVSRNFVTTEKILLVDWDLEAPGLHRFFTRYEKPNHADKLGVIDYFSNIAELLEENREIYRTILSEKGWGTLNKLMPLGDYVISDILPGIDLMKAGRFDTQYPERVSSFDWVEFYNQFGGVINSFRELISGKYTYCFIDSRTGLTDISGICTMLLPEKLVAVFSPNSQNLDGLIDVVSKAIEYRRFSGDFRPLSVFPLPSRIDLAEEDLRKEWRNKCKGAFEDLFRRAYDLSTCDLSSYFDKVQIPHVSYYSYGEKIAVEEQDSSDALSLAGRYDEFYHTLLETSFAWEISSLSDAAFKPESVSPKRGTRIYLSSTFGDLEDYRAGVLRVIDRLRLQGYAVEWAGMEAFSAAAQTPLAECQRYVDQADLYVGIFGVRYGSQISDTGMSFTEAEFRRAVERKIPLLLFLIDEDNAAIKPKDFERDPESLKRLIALKHEISEKHTVSFFKSPEDLAAQVLTALARYLPQTPSAAPQRADLATAREQYATHLVDALDKIDATRIAASLDQTLERIALTDVYVPLKVSVVIPEHDVFDHAAMIAEWKLSDEREMERARVEQERLTSLPLHDALAKFPGLVILGDPGSGKSTFLKYAASAFAQNAQTARLGITEPRLPIFVTIAAYAERLREGNRQISLADYFATYYRDVRGIAYNLTPLFQDALAQGKALVLLDGLDQVRDPAERARVADHVEKFWNAHRTSGNRLVITSRIIGYEKLRAEGLTHLTLHDFDADAIKLFLRQWCPVIERAAESDPALAARNAARERRELQDAIFRGSSGVRELAANPLLLTLLALIKRKGVRLPEQRVELYEEYVKALVENWALHRNADHIITQTTKYAEVERVLAALALWMRETNPEAGTVDQPAIENWLTQRYGGATISPDAARRAAQKFVTDLRQGSGLIVERGHRVYGFIHQTLEEYLAAKGLCYLDDTGLDALIAKMRAREMFARDIWRETTLLAVGHLSVIQRTPHRAAQLVERFLREELSGDARGLNVVRAGEALRDLGRAGVTAAVCNATLQALQVTMQSSAIAPRVRAAAGESLDALGWLPDDLDAFVHIPEGDPSTLPAASLRAGFWIAKYPVTHHQYEKFVNAGGYANEKYWRDQRGVDENGRAKNLKDEAWKWLKRNGGAERRPALWDNPRFHRAGYPVIGVTWYEAAAYCAWMTEELQKQGGRGAGEQGSIQLPLSNLPLAFSNLQVRLPTEAEWVRAAGGEQNTRYPWDAVNPKSQLPTSNLKSLISNVVARANVRESEIGGTTPVAMYPDGVRVTEKGDPIWDLAGNVWEWTSTLYGGYEGAYVRGGSWYNKADDVSISSRNHWDRDLGNDLYGLRVVVASPNFPP